MVTGGLGEQTAGLSMSAGCLLWVSVFPACSPPSSGVITGDFSYESDGVLRLDLNAVSKYYPFNIVFVDMIQLIACVVTCYLLFNRIYSTRYKCILLYECRKCMPEFQALSWGNFRMNRAQLVLPAISQTFIVCIRLLSEQARPSRIFLHIIALCKIRLTHSDRLA